MNPAIVFLIVFLTLIFSVTIITSIVLYIRSTKKRKEAENNTMSIIASQGLTITKEIGELLIDDYHQKWTLKGYSTIYNYSDIIEISEIQNGTKTKISAGIGVGVGVGNFGVGISSSKKVNMTISFWAIDITVRNSSSPLVQLVLYHGAPIRIGDFAYNATNLLREKYVAQLKQKQDAGTRTVTPTTVTAVSGVINTKIVGVTKENDKGIPIQAILPMINDDSDLVLVREKNNLYDANAIKVFADHQHIGYLKSSIAQQIAPLMDQGKIIDVELSEVTGGGEKNYGCNIKINL